ncbi:alginate O-acetyltransferase AlgX-related protein [Aquimarina macrocephali]|uniref:alginate O-acetyltransferase AlgX-related protein n=1 Tax=Aquimarina macrocephali TaxID=666563 RepID=UPI0004677EC8|nr:hypothetical protein [Aquimarina macrocephali]
MKNIYHKIVVIVFLAFLYIPLIVGVIKKDEKISKNENRKLTELPDFPATLDSVNGYFNKFDSYYKDHYGFRESFLFLYSKLKYLMYDSTSENIVIGKDRWLFLNEGNGDPINDYRNINVLPDKKIESYANYLQEKSDWLEEKGIKYYFFICPNKHSIYFDQLPSYVKKVNEGSNYNKLIAYLKTHTTIKVVDVKDLLLEEKKKSEIFIYSPKGTHWNAIGANYAQFELAKIIQQDFPDRIIPKLEDLKDFNLEYSNYDSSGNMIGLANLEQEVPIPNLIACEDNLITNGQNFKCNCNKNPNGLKALIFRDSYFIEMTRYLTNYFKYSNFIWSGLTFKDLKQQLDSDNYDIVIESYVERYLEDKKPESKQFSKDKKYIKKVFGELKTTIFESKCFDKLGLQFQEEEEGEVERNCSNLKFSILKEPVTNIYLNNLTTLKNSNAIAYFEFESSIETTFQLFYTIIDESVNGWPYDNNKMIEHKVIKGLNKIYIPIIVDQLDDSILFHIGGLGGTYSIKKVHIKKIEL